MTFDLVTGGAGFIGSHLVRRLVEEGRRVHVVDDLSTGDISRLEPVAEQIEIVRADLVVADLEPIVRGAERVFHLAAVPSVPRSVRDPLTSHGASATATLRLLIAARASNVGHFVLSSSSSVYGDTTVSPKHEGLPMDPVSPYGVAKAAAEGYTRAFARLYGLRTAILRYFNVFGPGQDERSPYAAVIPLFIRRALADEELIVYGDGRQTRDFTYVENVIDANLAAARDTSAAGRVYNIAAGSPRSLLDLIRDLERSLGRVLKVTHAPPRPGDIVHSHADISAADRDLGWVPRIAFAEGLRRTLDWYRR